MQKRATEYQISGYYGAVSLVLVRFSGYASSMLWNMRMIVTNSEATNQQIPEHG
jgi:hypothetical protein